VERSNKMKGGRKMKESISRDYCYLMAYHAATGKLFVYVDDENQFDIPSDYSVLQQTIKKDLFEKLSEEAKEVIRLVLNTPMEIFVLARSPKNGRPPFYIPKKKEVLNVRVLADYLRWDQNFSWKIKKINKVFKELRAFVDLL